MHISIRNFVFVGASLGGALGTLSASPITDPSNDFIPSFTGTKSPDLDVISAFATFDGTTFHIGGTLNGVIGTLPTSTYVFGVNRGDASNNFAAISLPNVVFDTVITLTGAGVLGGRDLVANANLALPAGAAHISGSSFTIDVPLTQLPSLGLQPLQYGFNLWPRDTTPVGNAQIADFAPDATTFTAAAVPEPSSWLLIGVGLAGLVVMGRHRRAQR